MSKVPAGKGEDVAIKRIQVMFGSTEPPCVEEKVGIGFLKVILSVGKRVRELGRVYHVKMRR